MYLKPRQVFEQFLIEEKRTRINDIGRQMIEYVATGEEIFGVVSSAEPHEVEKWRALKHEISHVIIQHLGRAKAAVGDRLINGEKKYLVEAVDNVIGAGQFYLYYVKERFDL